MKTISLTLPIPVQKALRDLGQDIRNARLRRRIQAKIMAERAGIARTTLHKIERGDPGVSMGSYVTVLFVLGLLDRVSTLAALPADVVGMRLEEEKLPKRIRHVKRDA